MPHTQQMFHILYDLETRFVSLTDLEKYLSQLSVLEPYVPRTWAKGEDRNTARVCVAPTLAGCFHAVKLFGVFKRCVYAGDGDDGFMSYENDDEVYPIVILTVEGEFIRPTKEQVPDVDYTDEHWSLHSVRVVDKQLVWLDNRSVELDPTPDEDNEYHFKALHPVTNLNGRHHPWIDRKGHPLISSDKGRDDWITKSAVLSAHHLCYDTSYGHDNLVFIMPELPTTGYCICFPLDGSDTYRGRLDGCKRFSGFVDCNGEPLFEDDWIVINPDSPWSDKVVEQSASLLRFGACIHLYDSHTWAIVSCSMTCDYIALSELCPKGYILKGVYSKDHRDFSQRYRKQLDALGLTYTKPTVIRHSDPKATVIKGMDLFGGTDK